MPAFVSVGFPAEVRGTTSLVAQKYRQEQCPEESERQYNDNPNYWQPRFASKMSIDPHFYGRSL
jgi:hypothetical protein